MGCEQLLALAGQVLRRAGDRECRYPAGARFPGSRPARTIPGGGRSAVKSLGGFVKIPGGTPAEFLNFEELEPALGPEV